VVAESDGLAATAAAHLRRPGLVVLTGPPGAGRSTLLRAIAAATPGPAYTGGGLAMLSGVPALALSRAVRARLPGHDVHLLTEAVRSRVRGGLLVLDDLQYADPVTRAALPMLAAHCRVLAALRTPHRVDLSGYRDASWLPVPPLDRDRAIDLARRTAAHLDEATLHAVVDRAGGNPLAITALARQAAAGRGPAGADIDQVAYAIATALADLPRAARTALAALGLLGRPAPAGLLGPGVPDLLAAGLITTAPPAAAPSSSAVPSTPSPSTPSSTGPFSTAPSPTAGVPSAPSSSPFSAGPSSAAPSPSVAILPTSTYVAETAAGLLDAAARTELHLRLAELTPPAEAAQHLAAAGDHAGAYRRALAAADHAAGSERAGLLLFACAQPIPVDPRVRIAAADAALAAGRPRAAAQVLTTPAPLGVEADVLRGEALVQAGAPAEARAAVQRVPDAAPAAVVAARDRVLLLADLALDPAAASDLADKIGAHYPAPPPGLAAALAAVRAAHRVAGWDTDLAATAAAGTDPLTSRWSAWLLVETLAADGRLAESAAAALRAAESCAADLAYGWQTRFLAAADWALALHGAPLPPDAPSANAPLPAGAHPADAPVPPGAHPADAPVPPGAHPAGASLLPGARPTHAAGPADAARSSPSTRSAASAHSAGFTESAGSAAAGRSFATADDPAALPADSVIRRAADLIDRALPAVALGYATAATALVEADTGLLAAARARLEQAPVHPATAWVAREAAWLDGQPDRAARPAAQTGAGLLHGLHEITGRWAAYDTHTFSAAGIPDGLPAAARRTLLAWATGTGFGAAAEAWTPTARREQIRCLLAAGVHENDPARAVQALLAAEKLADAAGLTVLAGRARRLLRRHRVHRDVRSPRSGTQLTNRETDVLRLVAAGEPTRRIAGQLGISAETVDTHIRSGMRKLGARTRTEAAALAFAATAGEDRR
jgi:DNA-binding NarL/FixJ family response regulator